MSNQIKMATSASIIELYERGWSQRLIARELDLDRETVSRHILLHTAPEAKPAIPPTGSEPLEGSNPAIVPPGPETIDAQTGGAEWTLACKDATGV